MKNKEVFFLSNILLSLFIILKSVDLIMSLIFIGKNNIIEKNLLSVFFLKNYNFLLLTFFIIISLCFLMNIIIYKFKLEEVYILEISLYILLIIINIYILYNNFNVIKMSMI